MSTPQESTKTMPSVECSQKYMSWHMKEMNQSIKDLCAILRSIDLTLKSFSELTINAIKKPVQNKSVIDDVPF
jgi:hypothetical protein